MPDWAVIRAEYVAGGMGYRALAERHGIPFKTLASRAYREGWVDERKRHRAEVARRTSEKVAKQEAAEAAKKLNKLRHAADSMSGVIDGVFADAEQFYRHLVTLRSEDGSETVERVFGKMDARAVRDITAALKDLTAVIRDLYDMPSLVDREAREMALERLELERQKAAVGKETGEDETGVLLLSPVEAETDGAE